jgi:Fe-S-cluster-containing dehydrogenase component/DMSO reductase anchor subunit
MTNCFVFDINKCVGCHACVLACSIENSTNIQTNWRQVDEFNELKYPDLPVFYHSIACNHCDDPLCLKSCPANAYYRDEETNAIIHEPDKCFGCKYCTWACPYDAPKYNTETKLIEKCTFCNDRIKEGLKPACANLCPTGALDFSLLVNAENNKTVGFPEKNIGPNIVFVPFRNESTGPTIAVHQSDQSTKELLVEKCKQLPKKIELEKEWVLILFTLIVAFIAAWFSASVYNPDVNINPLYFILSGISALILSSIHLGKKWRAYRSILNLKTSWLSREIFFFSSFLTFGVMSLFNFLNPFANIIAVSSAIATVVSVDMIYKYTENKRIYGLHSSYVTFTSLLLFGAFMEFVWLVAALLVLKFVLYVGRKKITITEFSYGNFILSLLRIIIGFLLPIYLYLIDCQNHIIILFLITGEVLDRIEFYNTMDVITPQKQLLKQVNSEL